MKHDFKQQTVLYIGVINIVNYKNKFLLNIFRFEGSEKRYFINSSKFVAFDGCRYKRV